MLGLARQTPAAGTSVPTPMFGDVLLQNEEGQLRADIRIADSIDPAAPVSVIGRHSKTSFLSMSINLAFTMAEFALALTEMRS